MEPSAIEALVSAYRRLKIVDVLPGDADAGDSVVVPMRKPGRPAVSGR